MVALAGDREHHFVYAIGLTERWLALVAQATGDLAEAGRALAAALAAPALAGLVDRMDPRRASAPGRFA